MTPLLRLDPTALGAPPLVDVNVSTVPGPGPARVSALAPERERDNAEVLATAAASGGVLRPVARLGGPRGRRRAPRAAVQPPVDLDGFAAVRLTPHRDGLPPAAILDDLARRELPVFVHAGEAMAPAVVERRLVGVLRGPVVLAHLGAHPASAPDLAAALDLARRYDRVYLETSTAWLAEFVAAAVRAVPSKVFFGSGAPFMHPAVAWAHVAAAVVDDERALGVAHRNAEEVLGW